MRTALISLVIALSCSATVAGEFSDPIPILVAGRPLDVEQLGHAAPFVVDFDRDGVKDLLVGEFYQGRLRIYRNVGSNKEPQFDGYTLFQNGKPSGRILSSCCMGFGPQMIDYDGDGLLDILSGNWIFQVVLFRGLPDGSFGAGDPIKDRDNHPINVGYGVTAFAVDWDADDDLDLLAGTVEHSDQGNVYLVRNEGTVEQFAFGKPEKLLADGKPIVAVDGGAAPVAADWDGDGKLDLILGCGGGSVRWYRNGGSAQEAELSSFEVLIDPPTENSQRGIRAKPCVTDWNEDGKLDLLVGDAGDRFEKQLSEEEEQWREQAIDQQAAYLKEWSEVFGRYRKLASATATIADSKREDQQQRLATARDEMIRLSTIRAQFSVQEASLQPGTQTHGRVWLFLNISSQSEPVAAK